MVLPPLTQLPHGGEVIDSKIFLPDFSHFSFRREDTVRVLQVRVSPSRKGNFRTYKKPVCNWCFWTDKLIQCKCNSYRGKLMNESRNLKIYSLYCVLLFQYIWRNGYCFVHCPLLLMAIIWHHFCICIWHACGMSMWNCLALGLVKWACPPGVSLVSVL